MQQELTINAAAFKARCLDLMDQIASRKLLQVTITKRGKPVSVLRAPEAPSRRSVIGAMAGHFPQLSDADLAELDKEASSLQAHWPDVDAMERSMIEQLKDRH